MKGNSRTFVIFAATSLVVGVSRFFMKGWLQPLGVPDVVGSFVASITLLVLVGWAVFFVREGRAPHGRYWIAAAWFAALAAWCQGLVIAGILTTARTGIATYYEEWIGSHRGALRPVPHALWHGIAAVPVVIAGMILGAPIYWLAKRGRGPAPAPTK